MSHDPNDPKIDETDSRDARLDRHLDALRADGDREGGPSPEALARTLAMLAADPPQAAFPSGTDIPACVSAKPNTIRAEYRSTQAEMPVPPKSATDGDATRRSRGPANPKGWFQMSFVQKIAAAASFAAAACLVWFMFFVFSTMGASVAYADVVEKVAKARGLAYTTTVQMLGNGVATSLRTIRGEGNRSRIELPGGRVMISDGARYLVLDPAAKTATRIETTGGPTTAPSGAPRAIDLVAAFKSAAGDRAEPLGERTIDGVVATGFRAPWNVDGKLVVWADKRSAEPVRVELTMKVMGRETTSVLDRFEIDPPTDAATFSTDVPAGYAVETQRVDVTLASQRKLAEAVAAVLKAYADASGGALPASLTDWADLMRMDDKGKARVDLQAIGTMSGQLFGLPNGFGYAGKGAKLGDADKIVFWYRPAKSEKYRVVFGDLRIDDVDAARIPATQPTK